MNSKLATETKRNSDRRSPYTVKQNQLNRALSSDLKTLIQNPVYSRKGSLKKYTRKIQGVISKPDLFVGKGAHQIVQKHQARLNAERLARIELPNFKKVKNKTAEQTVLSTDPLPRYPDSLSLVHDSSMIIEPPHNSHPVPSKDHRKLLPRSQVKKPNRPSLHQETFQIGVCPPKSSTRSIHSVLDNKLDEKRTSFGQWLALSSQNEMVPVKSLQELLGVEHVDLLHELLQECYIPTTSLLKWHPDLAQVNKSLKEELEARLTFMKITDLQTLLDNMFTAEEYTEQSFQELVGQEFNITQYPQKLELSRTIFKDKPKVSGLTLKDRFFSLLDEWEPVDEEPARLSQVLKFSRTRLLELLETESSTGTLAAGRILDVMENHSLIQTNKERLWMLGYLYSFNQSYSHVPVAEAFAEQEIFEELSDDIGEEEGSAAETTFENTSMLATGEFGELI